jgi:hypothetical protein
LVRPSAACVRRLARTKRVHHHPHFTTTVVPPTPCCTNITTIAPALRPIHHIDCPPTTA